MSPHTKLEHGICAQLWPCWAYVCGNLKILVLEEINLFSTFPAVVGGDFQVVLFSALSALCPPAWESSCSDFIASCIMYTWKMVGWVRGFLLSTRKEIYQVTRKRLLWKKPHIYHKSNQKGLWMRYKGTLLWAEVNWNWVFLFDFKTWIFNTSEMQMLVCTLPALPAPRCLFYGTVCSPGATYSSDGRGCSWQPCPCGSDGTSPRLGREGEHHVASKP